MRSVFHCRAGRGEYIIIYNYHMCFSWLIIPRATCRERDIASLLCVCLYVCICVSIVGSLAKFQEDPLMNIHQTWYTSMAW